MLCLTVPSLTCPASSFCSATSSASQPNLLFLEPLPLPTATEALTDVWIERWLPDKLPNTSLCQRERRKASSFLSVATDGVCLSLRLCCRLSLAQPSTQRLGGERDVETSYHHQSYLTNLWLLTLHLRNLFPLDVFLNYSKRLLC